MLNSTWLGRVTFSDALALQEEIVARKTADPSAPDELLLLEHEPVYTIGRTPDQTSLRDPANLPHPVVQTNRGGQATYHGPGQLIGYPILDLRTRGQDLHRYLRGLEEVLIALLAEYGVAGERSPGFAVNICGDLAPFNAITPCGLAGVEMTSLSHECGREITVREAADRMKTHFGAYDCAKLAVSGE